MGSKHKLLAILAFACWASISPPTAGQPAPLPSKEDKEGWQAVDQQIQLVWAEFCGLLRAGDIESALLYFVDGEREKYRAALRDRGGPVSELPASWGEIRMTNEHFGPFIVYAMIYTTDQGERRLAQPIFYRDESGRWLLSSL